MQDLYTLGPRLDLLRDWPKLVLGGGGLPAGASLVGALDTSLLSFSFSLKVFSKFFSSFLVLFPPLFPPPSKGPAKSVQDAGQWGELVRKVYAV